MTHQQKTRKTNHGAAHNPTATKEIRNEDQSDQRIRG
jgi:hypothetical protein